MTIPRGCDAETGPIVPFRALHTPSRAHDGYPYVHLGGGVLTDYTDLSSIAVDGDVSASGKLKGGQQATQKGDAVLLGNDGKIPATLYDKGTVDLSGYYTSAQVDQKLATKADTSAVNSLVNACTKRYQGTITGNGSTKNFTLTHSLGRLGSLTILDSNGKGCMTDYTMTTTQVTLEWGTAPANGKTYTIIVIG